MIQRNHLTTGIVFMLAACLGLSGCGQATKDGPATTRDWKIVLKGDGAEHAFPVEIMNIYLVDPDYEDEYPEVFEIEGDGIHLVGAFPLGLRVGYGTDYNVLLDRPITVQIQSQEAADVGVQDKFSHIKFPGDSQRYVKGGKITFTKKSGKYVGKDGDLTLTGTIELKVDGPDGMSVQTYTGTISVHPVTWG